MSVFKIDMFVLGITLSIPNFKVNGNAPLEQNMNSSQSLWVLFQRLLFTRHPKKIWHAIHHRVHAGI